MHGNMSLKFKIIPVNLTRKQMVLENLENKNQLDATYYFIVLLIGSTCFGHYYAHHQVLTTNVDYHIGRFVL